MATRASSKSGSGSTEQRASMTSSDNDCERARRRNSSRSLKRAIVQAQAKKLVPSSKSFALRVTTRNTSCNKSSASVKLGSSDRINARKPSWCFTKSCCTRIVFSEDGSPVSPSGDALNCGSFDIPVNPEHWPYYHPKRLRLAKHANSGANVSNSLQLQQVK